MVLREPRINGMERERVLFVDSRKTCGFFNYRRVLELIKC